MYHNIIKEKNMDEQFPLALAVGTNVNGYIVNKVIGQGGFGITYLAFDTQTSKAVALKEYLPASVALRNEAGTVTPYSVSGENDFAQGKESFLKEAQNLGRFRHEAIVQVLGYFEANGTAYTVMEFVKGDTLSHRIKQLKAEGKTMSEEEIMTWFVSVMNGLECVHREQFMHRDIKPDNIMINPETGKGCLIDFGAARHDAGGKTKSLSVVLTPGFAPIEQYSSDGKGQGTWTDVYALGATVWCAMTGTAPKDAPGRSTAMIYNEPDPILCDREKLINSGYSAELVDTVIEMLAMNSTERLKTIADVKKSLIDKENANNTTPTSNETEKSADIDNATIMPKHGAVDEDDISWHEQLGGIDDCVQSKNVAYKSCKVKVNQGNTIWFYVRKCLKGCNFKGRASRKEYWSFMLWCWLVTIAMSLVRIDTVISNYGILGVVIYLLRTFCLISVVFFPHLLAVTFRRAHDIGYSSRKIVLLIFGTVAVGFVLGWGLFKLLIHFDVFDALGGYIIYLTLVIAWCLGAFAEKISLFVLFSGFTTIIAVFIVVIYFFTKNSQPGENKWGANPIQKNLEIIEKVDLRKLSLSIFTIVLLLFLIIFLETRPTPQEIFDKGCKYYYGQNGVEKNYKKAFELFTEAAEKGQSDAMVQLGFMYDGGMYVKENKKSAVYWFQKAAEAGNAWGEYLLADCYRIGIGVTRDYKLAFHWYQKAAEQGHAEATCQLGFCYFGGEGTVKNYEKAFKYFLNAAKQDVSRAQGMIASCYEYGWGVKRNRSEAIRWYEKLAAQNDEYAVHAKEALKRLK